MRKKVLIGISLRHVHLTEETYLKLFGDTNITVKKEVLQPGEFASNSVVTIKTELGSIDNVRVMGPFRTYNQVEISKTDSYKLKVNPPVRKSGDLNNSETITLVGPKSEITLNNALIISNRHMHITPEQAQTLNLKDNQKLIAYIDTEKRGAIELYVKYTPKGSEEIHLDSDDANAFLLLTGDEIEVEI